MKITIRNETWFWRTFGLDQLRSITREWNRIWGRTLELESLQTSQRVWERELPRLEFQMRWSCRNVSGHPMLKNWRSLKLRTLAAQLAKRHGVEHFEAIYGILSARYAAPHMWQIVRERRINRAKNRGLNLDPREISVSDEASRFFVRSEQTCEGFVACSSEARHMFFRDVYV